MNESVERRGATIIRHGRPPKQVDWLARHCGVVGGFATLTLSRARHVLGPTMPSGTRPCARWKLRTAASVLAPKLPSAATPTLACTCLVSSPVIPRRRVGRPSGPPGWAGGSTDGISTGAGAVPFMIVPTTERKVLMLKRGSILREVHSL